MVKLRVHSFAMSLDGYGAGPRNHFGVGFCADSLAKPVEVTDLNLPCRRARLAFVSLRPVLLDFGV
jgi:hypothetical protein